MDRLQKNRNYIDFEDREERVRELLLYIKDKRCMRCGEQKMYIDFRHQEDVCDRCWYRGQMLRKKIYRPNRNWKMYRTDIPDLYHNSITMDEMWSIYNYPVYREEAFAE